MAVAYDRLYWLDLMFVPDWPYFMSKHTLNPITFSLASKLASEPFKCKSLGDEQCAQTYSLTL